MEVELLQENNQITSICKHSSCCWTKCKNDALQMEQDQSSTSSRVSSRFMCSGSWMSFSVNWAPRSSACFWAFSSRGNQSWNEKRCLQHRSLSGWKECFVCPQQSAQVRRQKLNVGNFNCFFLTVQIGTQSENYFTRKLSRTHKYTQTKVNKEIKGRAEQIDYKGNW